VPPGQIAPHAVIDPSALRAEKAYPDGTISAWGASWAGGTGAASDNGYTKIYSTATAFAALKADGSITAWGSSGSGGTGAPSDNGYTKIYSTVGAFAALSEGAPVPP
jgi:hypothetical protein